MSAPSEVSERITAARKEAETLKEQIRANREAMNDTTRKYFIVIYMHLDDPVVNMFHIIPLVFFFFLLLFVSPSLFHFTHILFNFITYITSLTHCTHLLFIHIIEYRCYCA